jgi:hypothetical protein
MAKLTSPDLETFIEHLMRVSASRRVLARMLYLSIY